MERCFLRHYRGPDVHPGNLLVLPEWKEFSDQKVEDFIIETCLDEMLPCCKLGFELRLGLYLSDSG